MIKIEKLWYGGQESTRYWGSGKRGHCPVCKMTLSNKKMAKNFCAKPLKPLNFSVEGTESGRFPDLEGIKTQITYIWSFHMESGRFPDLEGIKTD